MDLTANIRDSSIDPLDPANVVSYDSVQGQQEINAIESEGKSEGEPDPSSQSCSLSLEPSLNDKSSSSLDIKELCGIVEDENLKLYMDFIHLLKDASLDNEGIGEEDLNHL